MATAKEKLASGLKSVSNTLTKVDRKYLDNSGLDMHSWGSVASQHARARPGRIKRKRGLKTSAQVARVSGDKAISATQFATNNIGTIEIASRAIQGTAITGMSATGIGLVAAAGAFSLAYSGAAAVSAYKTNQHIKGLQSILKKSSSCHCYSVSMEDGGIGSPTKDAYHEFIKDTVLPAIVSKKKRKLRRKAVSSVPVVGGTVIGVESGLRSVGKRLIGSRSRGRHFYAEILAIHLITRHCELAEAIVAELFSEEEMQEIKNMNSDEAGPLIFSKMAST